MKMIKAFGMLLLLLMVAGGGLAQEGPTNTVFILDASGSMRAAMGDGTRLDAAQQALQTLVAEIPPGETISLWAYGHRLSQDDPAASCQDIEQVIPLGAFDEGAFLSAVNGLNAIGYTPISQTLRQVAATLPEGGRNTVVLVSDGEETCGGDPCAVAAELASSGVQLRVHTIGFNVDVATRLQLECIAEVSGGTYFNAEDADELSEVLILASAFDSGTLQLVDEAGNRLTALEFTAVDTLFGATETGTGSMSLAPGDYTVTVNTTPPIEETVTIEVDQTTNIVVAAPGRIEITDPAGQVMADQAFDVFEVPTEEAIGNFVGSAAVQPGDYRVVVATTPPFEREVAVQAGQTVQFSANPNGVLVPVFADGSSTEGVYTVLYDANGQVVETFLGGPIEVAPGQYTLAFDTMPETRRQVTVVAGEQLEVMLDLPGRLEIVDGGGAPTDLYFQVHEAETGEYIGAEFGGAELQPGIYSVELDIQGYPPTVVAVSGAETTTLVLQTGVLEIVNLPDDGDVTFYRLGTDGAYSQEAFYLYDIEFEDGRVRIYADTYRIEVRDGNFNVVFDEIVEVVPDAVTMIAMP